MKYEKYASVASSQDALEFSFVSTGPKGAVQKLVQFTETNNPNIYNLAFGDWLSGGGIDDQVKNDNKDRNKILATVAATVYEFTARHPDKFVFFTGSTPERTRLYRIAITNNFEELSVDFEVFGVVNDEKGYYAQPFEKGKDYFAFLIKRKFS